MWLALPQIPFRLIWRYRPPRHPSPDRYAKSEYHAALRTGVADVSAVLSHKLAFGYYVYSPGYAAGAGGSIANVMAIVRLCGQPLQHFVWDIANTRVDGCILTQDLAFLQTGATAAGIMTLEISAALLWTRGSNGRISTHATEASSAPRTAQAFQTSANRDRGVRQWVAAGGVPDPYVPPPDVPPVPTVRAAGAVRSREQHAGAGGPAAVNGGGFHNQDERARSAPAKAKRGK